MTARDLLRKAAGAGATALAACSPQSAQLSTRVTERQNHSVTPTDEASTSSTEAPTTSTATTTTVVIAQTSTTLVLPEYEGPPSDAEWWTAQPGYDGTMPSGACGGALPPCWVMQRESRGDPTAISPYGLCDTGDTRCYGKWQASVGTWAGYGGYPNAALAPEAVQDEWARALWNGGRGCSHWGAC